MERNGGALGQGRGSEFLVISSDELDHLSSVSSCVYVGEDPEGTLVLVDAVRQEHWPALHCLHERWVNQLKELQLDEEDALLDLSSESNEPSEFSEVSSISGVATSSISCSAFSADLDPYDGLCIMSGPAVRGIVDWDSVE